MADKDSGACIGIGCCVGIIIIVGILFFGGFIGSSVACPNCGSHNTHKTDSVYVKAYDTTVDVYECNNCHEEFYKDRNS